MLTEAIAALPLLPLAGHHILLVEDEPLLLMSFEDTLLDFGCASVFTATAVAAALAVLEREPIDLAVLDLHLGTGTSYDLARTLRLRRVPFLFLSGSTLNDISVEFRDALFVPKPFEEPQLAAAIAVALDQRQAAAG